MMMMMMMCFFLLLLLQANDAHILALLINSTEPIMQAQQEVKSENVLTNLHKAHTRKKWRQNRKPDVQVFGVPPPSAPTI